MASCIPEPPLSATQGGEGQRKWHQELGLGTHRQHLINTCPSWRDRCQQAAGGTVEQTLRGQAPGQDMRLLAVSLMLYASLSSSMKWAQP